MFGGAAAVWLLWAIRLCDCGPHETTSRGICGPRATGWAALCQIVYLQQVLALKIL